MKRCALLIMLLCGAFLAQAADHAQIDDLQKELSDLRNRLNTQPHVATQSSNVDRVLDAHGCDCDSNIVKTKNGKLTIGMLVQVWYYGFQQDRKGLFNGAGAGVVDTNETQNNSGFRIRRTEIYMGMDINENINFFTNWDPAREATTFPTIYDNTANQGAFKRLNLVSPEYDKANGPKLGNTAVVSGVQSGAAGVNRSFKDAFINYHGVIPHHDFTVGLLKPKLGEEGIRNAGELDFIERPFIPFIVDDITRDTGVLVHGTWWDDRFQYWGGYFNGSENFLASETGTYLRAADHNASDFNYRVLVRPIWNDLSGCSCSSWAGRMELGMSSKMGEHGESGGVDPIADPVNGLNRRRNWAYFNDAWGYYGFGGPMRGWWVRGEWGSIHDRNAPATVLDDLGNGGASKGNAQSNPHVLTAQGWFVSTGYKLSQSVFADSLSGWLKPFEFCARYDTFQNVEVANQVNPGDTDQYKTTVITGGVNYYIKGNNAKIQANVITNRQPDGGDGHHFHNVRNSAFVLQFQVYY